MTAHRGVALVTGASSGVGASTACELAAAGFDVVLVARRQHRLEQTAESVRSLGQRALAIPADLTRPEAPQEVIDEVCQRWGGVDVLVNNAAVPRSGPIGEQEPRHWDLSLRLNLTVPFELSRLVLPHMRGKSWGWIVNMGSVSGLLAHAYAGPYSVAKRGLIALTELLAAENASAGVRTVCLCLGWVATEMAADPLKVGVSEDELLTTDDVARTVRWLVDSPARFTLGPVLRLTPTSPTAALESVWPRLAEALYTRGMDG